jgi:hypothetical protein
MACWQPLAAGLSENEEEKEMTNSTALETRTLAALSRPQWWTEPMLRQAVQALQQRVTRSAAGPARHRQTDSRSAVVDEIVRLAMQPDIQAALRGRRDPEEAVRDLATRYAFQRLMVQGQPFDQLDPLSQALVRRTLDLIYQRAFQIAERTGEDPLDEDPGLLLSICKSLSRYVPRRPMGAHISWKLRHYEGAVSRVMRQIEHLVRCPEVTESFVAYVLDAPLADDVKAHLLQLARGGGRSGVDPEAVIRFFALPATVAWVKRFARTAQTARTLYAEAEYGDLPWAGKRRLPANRRQGYLDEALARVARRDDLSLDSSDVDFHDVLEDPRTGEVTALTDARVLHKESFEEWVTRRALEERPDDPLWQAAELLYVRCLSSDEIIVGGMSSEETVTAARKRMEALQANPDVWRAWMAAP